MWRILCVSAVCACQPAHAWAAKTPTEWNNEGVNAAQGGDVETGVASVRHAVQAAPQDPLFRRNLSGMLTDWAGQCERQGRRDEAERLLREAIQHDPDNGRALALLGDLAYFSRSDFTQAVAYWKQAYGKLPAAEGRALADRISQAQRDQLIERGWRTAQTPHFDVKYQAHDDTALPPLQALLEASYARLHAALGGGPSKLTVILYAEPDLHRTYYQRDWALGFYDGRLRLLAREIGSDVGPAMVAHELCHAFLHHLYGETLPVWVHEGFAQLQEGPRPRSDDELKAEQGMASGSAWVPVKWLDRRFAHPSNRDDTLRAYVQARLVVDMLVTRYGMDRFKGFLQRLAQGAALEMAYDTAFAPSRWAQTDQPLMGGR